MGLVFFAGVFKIHPVTPKFVSNGKGSADPDPDNFLTLLEGHDDLVCSKMSGYGLLTQVPSIGATGYVTGFAGGAVDFRAGGLGIEIGLDGFVCSVSNLFVSIPFFLELVPN